MCVCVCEREREREREREIESRFSHYLQIQAEFKDTISKNYFSEILKNILQ